MFPQISQNAIRYNLERGASVDATVERCLRDGFLPEVRLSRQLPGLKKLTLRV